MAHYHTYPKIDLEKLEEITKRRYVFDKEENGKLFILLENKQALIIVREETYKAVVYHAKHRSINIDAIKKQFTKVFILCSYAKRDNALSLAKLCSRYNINQPRKKHLILFKEIGETNAKKTHYDKTAETII